MTRASIIVLVLAVASVAAADPRIHVVATGDTLGELAERYRVSIAELREWNAIEGDTIQIGQELTVEEISIQ